MYMNLLRARRWQDEEEMPRKAWKQAHVSGSDVHHERAPPHAKRMHALRKVKA
jgi:hypothetical protein